MKEPSFLDSLIKRYSSIDNNFLECEKSNQENLEFIKKKVKSCLTKKGSGNDENQQIFNTWLEIFTWNIFYRNNYSLKIIGKCENKSPDLCSQDKTLLVEVKHCSVPCEDKYLKQNYWYDRIPFNKDGFKKKIDYFIDDTCQKFDSFNKNYLEGQLFIFYTPSCSLINKCRFKRIDWKSNFLNSPQCTYKLKSKFKLFLLNVYSLKETLEVDVY